MRQRISHLRVPGAPVQGGQLPSWLRTLSPPPQLQQMKDQRRLYPDKSVYTQQIGPGLCFGALALMLRFFFEVPWRGRGEQPTHKGSCHSSPLGWGLTGWRPQEGPPSYSASLQSRPFPSTMGSPVRSWGIQSLHLRCGAHPKGPGA